MLYVWAYTWGEKWCRSLVFFIICLADYFNFFLVIALFVICVPTTYIGLSIKSTAILSFFHKIKIYDIMLGFGARPTTCMKSFENQWIKKLCARISCRLLDSYHRALYSSCMYSRDSTTLLTLKHDVILMGFGARNIKSNKMVCTRLRVSPPRL